MAVKGENIKVVRKLFFVWEDEKEIQWLNEMSKSGWHLQSISGLIKYIFIKGEPKNIVYQLDFKSSITLDDEYLQLFKDAGWDYLGNMFNWRYFIKEYEENGVNEIFTEHTDKIKRNKKILVILFPITLLNFIYGSLNLIGIIKYGNFFSFAVVPFANLVIAILLLIAISKIMKRNNQFKKQNL